jgi:predicted O-methyltransferase YrrM
MGRLVVSRQRHAIFVSVKIAAISAAISRRFAGGRSPQVAVDQLLSPMPGPFRTRLLSMYAGEPQIGADGQKHSIDGCTRISPAQGMWIYELCLARKPRNTLEIGMAYGFSTIYFLAAIERNGSGHHTAIDPFQLRAPGRWAGIGLQHARSLCPQSFRFIEETSFSGLIRLSHEGKQFDVIFIDGRHLFDYVIADFTLSADLCPVGGTIVLDDMFLPSIQSVAAFIRTNRPDFEPVSTPIDNIAVFRRIAFDDREMDSARRFDPRMLGAR